MIKYVVYAGAVRTEFILESSAQLFASNNPGAQIAVIDEPDIPTAMTSVERDLLSAQEGDVVYNIDTCQLERFSDGIWAAI